MDSPWGNVRNEPRRVTNAADRRALTIGEGRWRLWRLSNDEYSTLRSCATPIADNGTLIIRLHRSALVEGSLILPRAHTLLQNHFGPSSWRFDRHKGSFSFPFLLRLRGRPVANYIVECHDHHSFIYFPLFRVEEFEPDESDLYRFRPPLEMEFSRLEIEEFVACFYTWLVDSGRQINPSDVSPYFRTVGSEFMTYGCMDNDFFSRIYSSDEAFDAAVHELTTTLGKQAGKPAQIPVRQLIDQIVDWGSHEAL